MKRLIFVCMLMMISFMGFAQPRVSFGAEFSNEPQQFRTFGRKFFTPMNAVHFRGWGGMFNFAERGFEPVFNLNAPRFNQVRVYISDIPEFEKRFSPKRVDVVTFEIPDTASTTLLRFYDVNKAIEMLKVVKSVMTECTGKTKLSKKENDAYVKRIKKAMPNTAYFWDDYAGFNNKIEPMIICREDGGEPMIVFEGISYCRIKFKDFSTIIDPNFSGDETIMCEIQLPFNDTEEITRMIEKLNFTVNLPRQPQFMRRPR